MSVSGIDEITYGVEDLATSARFFADWGLKEVARTTLGTRASKRSTAARVLAGRGADDASLPPAFEEGPTLREVMWGVATRAELDALRRPLRRPARPLRNG